MKEEVYILKNQESFELKDIFECGQCFRWEKNTDNSYTGVIKQGVLNIKKDNEKKQIVIKGKIFNNENIENIVEKYFDLKTNYNDIKKILSKVDSYLEESIKFGEGIRILRQDFWETIISFIISANNNIPRIKKIINNLSKEYGEEIEWNGNKYYTFPTVENLSKASVEDLRNLGLGFRDKRVYKTTQMILNKEFDLDKISKIEDTKILRNELLKLDGVGEKVADCILLFSLHRFDVFPVDVWVRRVMNDLYIHNELEEKVKKEDIRNLAEEKFNNYQAMAQQYLFYWKRENS
ncbi:MAG: DNA-3-methyladenine glycosylase family protein [Candidatus Scatovivens sp.]